MNNRQLQWVNQNRSRSQRARGVGDIVGQLVSNLEDSWHGDRDALREAVSSITDENFAAHCKLGWIDQRIVTILVDEPTLVFDMQRRWQQPLEKQLKLAVKRGRNYRVRFDYDSHDLGRNGESAGR